jgi:hypothetical protein
VKVGVGAFATAAGAVWAKPGSAANPAASISITAMRAALQTIGFVMA